MKVAYVLGTSAGGTERHVAMLATGLAARGVAVRSTAQPRPGPPSALPRKRVHPRGRHGRRFRRSGTTC